MKKIIFLLVMVSNVFTYELYKEIKINDVSNDLMTYTFTTNSNTYYANNILVNSVIGNN